MIGEENGCALNDMGGLWYHQELKNDWMELLVYQVGLSLSVEEELK